MAIDGSKILLDGVRAIMARAGNRSGRPASVSNSTHLSIIDRSTADHRIRKMLEGRENGGEDRAVSQFFFTFRSVKDPRRNRKEKPKRKNIIKRGIKKISIMMKSWADHCSSDEESLIDEIAQELENQDLQDEDKQVEEPSGTAQDDDEDDDVQAVVVEKHYNFPDRPPYTAFVGNLAYSINDAETLKGEIGQLVTNRLGGQQVNVVQGRVGLDRTGKHRGFGYVEVETLDEVRNQKKSTHTKHIQV